MAVRLAADYPVIASQSSDWRGNLLQISGIAGFKFLRGSLKGIATSHFVLLAMTHISITALLNDHLQKTRLPRVRQPFGCIRG